jgi:hypothetical protein
MVERLNLEDLVLGLQVVESLRKLHMPDTPLYQLLRAEMPIYG